MRYLFLCCFLIQSTLGYSQFFVGESRETVKSALESNQFEFTEYSLTDSTSGISVFKEDNYQMIWVLDANDIVIRQTLIPEGEKGVNEFVKWFNEDFVIISDVEWKNYENGRIYILKLEYLLGEPFFSISLSPNSN